MKNFLLIFLTFISFGYLIGYSIGNIPNGEEVEGAFSKIMQTFNIQTREDLYIHNDLIISEGNLCVNGLCKNELIGTKTCRINQTDIRGKGCPKGSYLSHIGNTHGYCRYMNDISAEADYIKNNEDACQWDTTFLALMYNGVPPYITNVEGSVLVNTGGSTVNASQYDELLSGSVIETSANSFATIVFGDNSVIRLNENTKVVLVYDVTNTTARLEGGELWARVLRPFTAGSAFTIETGDLSAGVRGTSVFMKKTNTESAIAVLDSGSSGSQLIPVEVSYSGGNKKMLVPGSLASFNVYTGLKNKEITYPLFYVSPFIRNSIKDDTLYMEGILESSGSLVEKEKIMNELLNTYEHIIEGEEIFIDDPIVRSLDDISIIDKLKKQIAIDITNKYVVSEAMKNSIIEKIRSQSGSTETTHRIIDSYKKNWIFGMNDSDKQAIGNQLYNEKGLQSYRNGEISLPDPTNSSFTLAKLQFDGKGYYRIRSFDGVNPKYFKTYDKYEVSKWSKWHKITEPIPLQKIACKNDNGKNKSVKDYICNSCLRTTVNKTTGTIGLYRHALKPKADTLDITSRGCDKAIIGGSLTDISPFETYVMPPDISSTIDVNNTSFILAQKNIQNYITNLNLGDTIINSTNPIENTFNVDVNSFKKELIANQEMADKEEMDTNNDGVIDSSKKTTGKKKFNIINYLNGFPNSISGGYKKKPKITGGGN